MSTSNRNFLTDPIAGGSIVMAGDTPGSKYPNVFGCTAIAGGTGLAEITLDDPYAGLAEEDLIVMHNLGFASSQGRLTTAMSSYAAGVFFLEVFNSNTGAGTSALADATIHFLVFRRYKNQ